jgi:quinol monooxygenase YgiN
MAICLIFEAPGMIEAQYDQIRNDVAPGDRAPEGVLYHVAGPTGNGWYVVETWESGEAFDRFFQDRLQQALLRAGVTQPPRFLEVARIMQP